MIILGVKAKEVLAMPDCDHNSPKTAKDSAFTMNWYRYQAPLLLLGFLCIVAGGAVLRSARSVVMPLVIAWLLSFIFKPAVLRLEKEKYLEAWLSPCF